LVKAINERAKNNGSECEVGISDNGF